MILILILFPFLVVFLILLVLFIPMRIYCFLRRLRRPLSVGFLHPYCADMAGGERVLWASLASIQRHHPSISDAFVYAGLPASKWPALLSSALHRFAISLPHPVGCVPVRSHPLTRPHLYPVFTILGQSLGSVFLAIECLFKKPPHILIDTTGYAFTYPIFAWLGGCTVLSYTHYPTVSTDMILVVESGLASHNNHGLVQRLTWLRKLKTVYYRVFAAIYGFAGRRAARVMVNSHWTKDHIDAIWGIPARTSVVFPPVNTAEFQQLPLERDGEPQLIISISQYRPEKDQAKQLRAFGLFLQRCANFSGKLVLIGGVRDREDELRVNALRTLAADLGIADRVECLANVPFDTLKQYFARAHVGLHTMWCEHFGIGVVEMQAAGLLVIAHNSGGPKSDIIEPDSTGFLADTDKEYADILCDIFSQPLYTPRLSEIQRRARESSSKFSDDIFFEEFSKQLNLVC